MSSFISNDMVPVAGQIAPQSVAAAANATSGWVDAGAGLNLITVANLGALGGGTVTLSFEQATDNAGTGAKAATGFTGGASSTNNSQIAVDNRPELLDQKNGFRFVRAKLANVGGTGALVAATIQSANPRYIG